MTTHQTYQVPEIQLPVLFRTRPTWRVGVGSVNLGEWVGDVHGSDIDGVAGGHGRPLNPLKPRFEESLAPGVDLGGDLGHARHGGEDGKGVG